MSVQDFDLQVAGEFETLWDMYPKRLSKVDALEAYTARRRQGTPFRVLFVATQNYKQERRGEEAKFTMMPATFFGPKDRWKDFKDKTNGQTERKDGQWAPPTTRDLTALAKRDAEEEKQRQQTNETQTKDPSPTPKPEKSATERLKDL